MKEITAIILVIIFVQTVVYGLVNAVIAKKISKTKGETGKNSYNPFVVFIAASGVFAVIAGLIFCVLLLFQGQGSSLGDGIGLYFCCVIVFGPMFFAELILVVGGTVCGIADKIIKKKKQNNIAE